MQKTEMEFDIVTQKNEFTEIRNNLIAKRVDMIQHSRFNLNLVQNKAIAYLISKIQPDDPPNKIYVFNCREFQRLIRWSNTDTYNKTKAMLTALASNAWWIDQEDGKEALVRWLNIVHMNKGTGEIEISFHEDMVPYLLDLRNQQERDGRHYTTYKLQYISVMKHRYSPRLYEILKSYQYNNLKWTFECGTGSKRDLQRLLANTDMVTGKPIIPTRWAGWARFREDVLDPAVEEINQYTDIKVAFEGKSEDLQHRKVKKGVIRTIEFYMASKTTSEKKATENIIDCEYSITDENGKIKPGSIAQSFYDECERMKAIEEEEKKIQEYEQTEKIVETFRYPVVAEFLHTKGHKWEDNKISSLVEMALDTGSAVTDIPWKKRELWATDYISHYLRIIEATPEDTKTNTYKRLYDMVMKDYDMIAEKACQRLGGAAC